jgi:thiamine biosynthesis protein ThiI
MFERAVLVHYHEIGLKGRNRGRFERQLRDNIVAAIDGLAPRGVEKVASRLLVPVPDSSAEEVLLRVARTPGVSSASLAFITSRDPGEMERCGACGA